MPIGTTNISMDAIATELTIGSGGFTDNSMLATIYNSSNVVFSADSGSYHNLNMALPGLTDSFGVAIFNPYIVASNTGLKNWAGYNHDANVMLDVYIENNCPDIVDYVLEIAQNPGPLGGGTIFASGTLGPGASLNAPALNTLVAAYSNFASGPFMYSINARFTDTSIPPSRCTMNVTTSTDTDNLGQGLVRQNYTDANGPYDLLIFGQFDGNLVNGDVWNDSGNAISWNKRTSFDVYFT